MPEMPEEVPLDFLAIWQQIIFQHFSVLSFALYVAMIFFDWICLDLVVVWQYFFLF